VSHQPERREKNCLNCGTTVMGRYCLVCGQENVETRESFWSLSQHFVFDILHFDGKFWHTLEYLIRPGFVARQYCEGKRYNYLHPIRVYLLHRPCFLFCFALKGNQLQIKQNPLSKKDRIEITDSLNRHTKKNDNFESNTIAFWRFDCTAYAENFLRLNKLRKGALFSFQ
jgi:hypothetical protein